MNHFTFRYFSDLEKGDVFKFYPELDEKINISRFYTVYEKNERTTKINATYGKNIRYEFDNELPREVMIFHDRKRIQP